jgi:hypothetical protein
MATDMKLTHRCGFVEADLVWNKFSMSTEPTKVFTDMNKQPTFSMETRDYISGRADKNGFI